MRFGNMVHEEAEHDDQVTQAEFMKVRYEMPKRKGPRVNQKKVDQWKQRYAMMSRVDSMVRRIVGTQDLDHLEAVTSIVAETMRMDSALPGDAIRDAIIATESLYPHRYWQYGQRERYKSSRATHDPNGKWITIGADKSKPKGEQGGTPVFIGSDDRVLGGPKNLINRDIGNLSKPPEKTKQTPTQNRVFKEIEEFAEELEGFDNSNPYNLDWLMDEVEAEHRRQSEIVENHNQVIDSVQSMFGGGGRGGGNILNRVKRADDHDSILGFDELTEYIHREFPYFGNEFSGESLGASDYEGRIFEALKRGRITPPTLDSDEVLGEVYDRVSEMVEANIGAADPVVDSWDDDDDFGDWDPAPF